MITDRTAQDEMMEHDLPVAAALSPKKGGHAATPVEKTKEEGTTLDSLLKVGDVEEVGDVLGLPPVDEEEEVEQEE